MITIYAERRKNAGTGASKKIRAKNKCPAIVYGKNKSNIPIVLKKNDLVHITKKNLYTDTITLVINKTFHTVKINDIQYHPFKKQIIHIDFMYLK